MSFEWMTTWWKHFGRPGALRVVCARENGELVGLAPLEAVRITVRGVPLFRCLAVLGGQEADYKDFVLDQGRRWKALEAILRFCQEEIGGWELLISRGLHQDSPTNYLLPVVAQGLGWSHQARAGAICPYVPLGGEGADRWGEYRKREAASRYLRKGRKLQREKDARVERSTSVSAVEGFLRLHELGWSGRGGSRAIHSSRLAEFHRDLAQASGEKGQLVVATLYAGDQPVAAQYAYALRGVFYAYLTGFDPQWQEFSPGAALTVGLLDDLEREGYKEMDLLRGSEVYKFYFTQVARTTVEHVVAKSAGILRRYEVVEAVGR
jgi:CelD/BcsL family acetyltransferase involved in cellulose biosynthesis